jgi:hypothetical protein
MIHQAGGIAVMAHPGLTARDDVIPALVGAHLDGLEVYSSAHSPEQIVHYLALAREHRLAVSAGSDYHGDGKEAVAIGCVRLDDGQLEVLQARARAWRESAAIGQLRMKNEE